MFCIRCGTHLPDEAAFCSACGVPVTRVPAARPSGGPDEGGVLEPGGDPTGGAMAATPGEAAATRFAPASTEAGGWAPGPAAPVAAVAPRYGGFWRRFWGLLLDRFILGVAFTPVSLVVLTPLAAEDVEAWIDADMPAEVLGSLMGGLLTLALVTAVGNWLYSALMQSSRARGTLGQRALGLRVADAEGRRISFARATGRHFASILTGLTLGIGYLVMLWTSRRQTLHDLIAGTVVER